MRAVGAAFIESRPIWVNKCNRDFMSADVKKGRPLPI
jgi:hypothetical protein